MIASAVFYNRVGDGLFSIQDKVGGNSIINFRWNCSQDKIIWAQMLFLSNPIIGGYVDASNKILVNRCITANHLAAEIQELCEHWQQLFPHKPLWNWSRDDWVKFVRTKMVKKNIPEKGSHIYADNRLFSLCGIISQSHAQYLEGKLPDGASHRPNDQFRRTVMAPLLADIDITYPEFNT